MDDFFIPPPGLPICILNQFSWCNKFVRINKIIFYINNILIVYFKRFSENNVNFVLDLLFYKTEKIRENVEKHFEKVFSGKIL